MDAADRDRDQRRWRQFGDWMRQRRAAMQPERWTQDRLARELTAAGHAVKREWIVQIEGGEKPGAELAQAIQRLLGPAPEISDAPADLSELVRALGDLTEELRRSRIRQESFDERVLELLGAVTGTRPNPGARPSDSEPVTPAGTAQ